MGFFLRVSICEFNFNIIKNMHNAIFPATAMPDADWWHALWPNPDAVIHDIGIAQEMSVLDLACGDGYFTAAIARRIQPARVIGFDLDAVMLTAAQGYCAELVNCDWILGDAMALSQLIPYKMDYVLMANTFHGVPDQVGLCQQVAQVLSPTGQFAIINWHDIPREQTPVLGQPRGPKTELRMSASQTSAVLLSAGYKLDRLVELPPYHYAAIFTANTR
jgi:SAM-dependent methyltransferase